MARYIDAEKIKYHKLSVCGGHGLNFEYTVAYKHEVDALPTEDVISKEFLTRKEDEAYERGYAEGKSEVNGLVLEIDGVMGYFPKPFIIEAIKTHQNKGDRKALIKEMVDLAEENETLKDNNEHLAVMLTEAKCEVERLTNILNSYALQYGTVTDQQKVIDEAEKEFARKLFEEIEWEINDALKSNYNVLPQIEESEALWNRVNGKIDALRGMRGFIDDLKEKCIGEQNDKG